jgi:hypothetical protein
LPLDQVGNAFSPNPASCLSSAKQQTLGKWRM